MVLRALKGIGIDRKVSQGTKNILHGAAMSGEEFDLAYQAGYNRVIYYAESGINLFSFGEMGVGNTTIGSRVKRAHKVRPTDNWRTWLWSR